MKTLKKLLALVMTVAMLAGLFAIVGPVAGAAEEEETAAPVAEASALGPVSYTDLDEITNKSFEQAIQLFSKMVVIDGYPDGSFKPAGLLTRAEGAAIIARTLISRDAADILNTNSAPFGDVAADHWAAGAISYSQNRGLITGVGGGMFDPGNNLTKAQWLKILLCSLGYGANHEFEGAGWASRVFEVATNPDVDLFGRYDLYWFDLNNIELHTIEIPEDGLNDPIPREQAIAFLYNTIVLTRKVVYDQHMDVYAPVPADGATAALTGSAWGFLRDDIALVPWPNEVRDIYGRPHDWTIYWGYRNVWVYSEPTDTPTLLVTYKGSQTGNQLRTALQGIIGNLSNLRLTDKVNLFTNGYFNKDVWYVLASPSSIGAGRPLYRTDPTAAQIRDEDYVPFGTWAVLQAYLTEKGNSAAFGAAVTIEVYEYKTSKEENKKIDIVVKAPYLTQLIRKVADDSATILIDETGLEFRIYDVVTGSQANEIEVYARGVKGLANFKELYDNAAAGSYYFSTPYCYLSPYADDAFLFNDGGSLTPITDKTVIKPDKPDKDKPAKPHTNLTDRIAIINEELRPINEVYDAAKTIVGVATASSPTRLTVGGTAYNRSLFSPTIVEGDFTNNYTFYLDEDNVVLGAVYTAPGTPNIGGFLYLIEAQGSSASTTSLNSSSWARARVILGTGRALTVNLLTNNSNQFWNPMQGSTLSGAYSALPPYTQNGLDMTGYGNYTNPVTGQVGLRAGFYAYTIVDGMYRLTKLPAELVPMNEFQTLPLINPAPVVPPDVVNNHAKEPVIGADSPLINRGALYVGTYDHLVNGAVATDRINASNRAILTTVDGNGVRYFTGFDNFPRNTLDADAGDGHALVRLEPGGKNVAAEILYINTGDTEIGPPQMYAYLVEDSKLNNSTGAWTATFIDSEGNWQRDIVITNPADVTLDLLAHPLTATRFYVLLELNPGEWEATPVYAGGNTVIRPGSAPNSIAYISGGYNSKVTAAGKFALSDDPATGLQDTWYTYGETGTGVVLVPWAYESEPEFIGKDAAVATLDTSMIVVVLEDYGDAQVVFGIKMNIGRNALAGLQR